MLARIELMLMRVKDSGRESEKALIQFKMIVHSARGGRVRCTQTQELNKYKCSILANYRFNRSKKKTNIYLAELMANTIVSHVHEGFNY